MIVFSDVTKVFFNGQHGLRNVSFQIEPGEFLLLTGPTGSGKTTIMRLLTKEYDPSEGEIEFDGAPLSTVKQSQVHHLRRRIGVVFQDYRLLPEANVWENIALPLSIVGKKEEEIEQRVSDLLKLIRLEDKADLFPSELSGGEAQRVSIARALAIAPPVLFADEPTGNLDPETSKIIVKLLAKVNEMGTTVLMATHDVVVLEMLKNIRRLVLKNGELITDTGATHVKKAPSKPVKEESEDAHTDDDKDEKEPEDKKEDKPEVEVESLDEPVQEQKPETTAKPKKKHILGLFKKKQTEEVS